MGRGKSCEEWLRIERQEHDAIYLRKLACDASLLISPQIAWESEDYCFNTGKGIRGHRTRRALEAVGIRDLAGRRVLDVGCGDGYYSVLLAMFGAEMVCGIDISEVGVRIASERAVANDVRHRSLFSVQTASAIGYPNSFFDVVLLNQSLHHIIKYGNVGEEIYRVTKPGGRVVMAENLSHNPLIELMRLFTMRGNEAKGDCRLTYQDFNVIGAQFSRVSFEEMSLLFMIKRLFRGHLHRPWVRAFLRVIKHLDDILVAQIPPLKRCCGEIVVVMTK